MGSSCKGRIALVTGASRGIGAAIAQRLCAEGAKVAITARSLAPEDHPYDGSLQETLSKIEALGGEAVAIAADLSDPQQSREEIVDEAETRLGGAIDILVNDATACFYIPFVDISKNRFRISMEVNVRAPWELMQRVIPS